MNGVSNRRQEIKLNKFTEMLEYWSVRMLIGFILVTSTARSILLRKFAQATGGSIIPYLVRSSSNFSAGSGIVARSSSSISPTMY